MRLNNIQPKVVVCLFKNKYKYIQFHCAASQLCKRIVNRFQKAGYNIDIMRQTACLAFEAMLHSLVARRLFRPQIQWRPRCEALNNWLKLQVMIVFGWTHRG